MWAVDVCDGWFSLVQEEPAVGPRGTGGWSKGNGVLFQEELFFKKKRRNTRALTRALRRSMFRGGYPYQNSTFGACSLPASASK